MRIGELAERAGTSARTLRYYEQHGLLRARRTANGYRDYDEVDLRLVREIRSLLDIGFNLEETRPFVECLRSGHDSGSACPDSIEVLRRKLADLDDCITRLRAIRAQVSRELEREVGTMTANATDASFATEVLGSELPVLVDFWAEWCPPCRRMAPVLDELAAEYAGRVRVVKVDVDANPATARAYGILSMPTLSMFRGGTVVSQVVGAQPKEKLRAQIDAAL